MEVLDRAPERAAVETAIRRALGASGTSLVLRGGPGIGKTRILEFAAAAGQASGMTLLRTEGIETESHLGYAALHRLLLPLLASLGRLPAPQRHALGSAFGIDDSTSPDKFLVNLAVLTLITDAASERSLLCVVDEAHWMDAESLQALTFVARRLSSDRVVLLFATRASSGRSTELDELPRIEMVGLPPAESLELLTRSLGHDLERAIADRILKETEGNPLALIEIGSHLTPEELRRYGQIPEPLPVSHRIEDRILREVHRLPAGSQDLLLLAAAEPTGDITLLADAAAELGLDLDGLVPAEDLGLVSIGKTVAFRSSLVRSALYTSAAPADRRRIHAALAVATADATPAERRAWHLSAAAPSPNEALARELEVASARLGQRGATASQVELLERAASLSPDPAVRRRRLFDAASAGALAGDHRAAARLIAELSVMAPGPLLRLRAARLDASLLDFRRTFHHVPSRLIEASREMDQHSPTAAREMLVEAVLSIGFTREFAYDVQPIDVARAIRTHPASERADIDPRPDRADVELTELLLDAYATAIDTGFSAAAPALAAAVQRWVDEPSQPAYGRRWVVLPIWAALELWDHDALRLILTRDLRRARERSAVGSIAVLAFSMSTLEILAGHFAAAAALNAETHELNLMLEGHDNHRAIVDCELLSWRGDEVAARSAINSVRASSTKQGFGQGIRMADLALAVLANGSGQYVEAADAARRVVDDPMTGYASQALPELIEAASRVGRIDEATSALVDLDSRATASGTPLALGVLERSRAVLAADHRAEESFVLAVEILAATRATPDLARTHLLFGEWLRRQKRKADARIHLESARQLFDRMGAAAFAERARIELAATGITARRRRPDTAHELTPQEHQVAKVALDGASNREIAAQMFISVGTVDSHLRSTYRKLGITSRRDLRRVLHDDGVVVELGTPADQGPA